jgi:hypothetical protein
MRPLLISNPPSLPALASKDPSSLILKWLFAVTRPSRLILSAFIFTPLAASPDGNGFNATFEHFKVKHLPDLRRQEWLKKNAE